MQAELVQGSKGIFDVTVDDDLVYSKHSTGRFPDDGEVVKTMRERAAR